MPKKKKQTKAERREARLRKARQWILTYEGSHIVRAYRRRFNVDNTCAMKRAGQVRLENLRKKREEKELQNYNELFPDSDVRFFYIAGYTSGGAHTE